MTATRYSVAEKPDVPVRFPWLMLLLLAAPAGCCCFCFFPRFLTPVAGTSRRKLHGFHAEEAISCGWQLCVDSGWNSPKSAQKGIVECCKRCAQLSCELSCASAPWRERSGGSSRRQPA